MGNKKLFPFPLFIQLLQKNPVCIGYSVATRVVSLIPAIVFYYLWISRIRRYIYKSNIV
jgi:hypothetical protein